MNLPLERIDNSCYTTAHYGCNIIDYRTYPSDSLPPPHVRAIALGAHSALSEVRHVFVRVILSDGSVGVAEAPPRPTIYGETVHSITSVIEHELAPRVVGQTVSGQPQAAYLPFGNNWIR